MKKVFNIGGASYNSIIHLDTFPGPEPTTIHHCDFREAVANTGVGKSITLSKLGFDIVFHTLIGNDVYGDKIRSYLDHPNLTFIYDFDPKGTERHLNLMNARGERISIFMNSASDNPNLDYQKFVSYIKSSDIVVVNIANYCRNVLPICLKQNAPIWTDLHDYDGVSSYHQDFIDAATYIFLSSDNLKNYKPFMESMIHLGKKLVVCTHGRGGATALTEDGWLETPIISKYEMKDTNGAGDAFFSGFLYGFSKEYSLEKCMQLATISGGLCIQSEEIAAPNLSEALLEKQYYQYYRK